MNFPKHDALKVLLILTLSCLGGCNRTPSAVKDSAPKQPFNASKVKNAIPRHETRARYGNPKSYVVFGKRYYVSKTARGYNKEGIASWYGTKFHGRLTSSREPYNMYAMTAASKTLPLPSFVRVTNLANGKQIVVRVNDRGPFAPNRIIDLSYAAAKKLDFTRAGTTMVRVTAITPNKKVNLTTQQKITKVHVQPHPKLYLQVGAFSELKNARRVKDRLQKITKEPIHIRTTNKGEKQIYRVQVGPLIGVGESDRLHNLFDRQGFGDAITVIS